MTRILAIDQGTSGTKAVVVDDFGRVQALAEEVVTPSYLPGGGVEQDPAALLDSVLTVGRRALEAAGGSVDAVALANQGETVLAWDRSTGQPLSQAIVWQDRRAETVTTALAGQADEIAQRTGLVLDPYFSAPKMRWIRDNVTREGVVTTSDSWLVHQLCGAFVTDVATASRSLVLDIDGIRWDDELLDLFGLADEELPEIVDNDQQIGATTAFGPAIPVAGLIVDQQAALLAEACLERGTAKCTYGTGAFLLAQAGDEAPRSEQGLTTSVAWRLRDELRYCADGQVYTAASAVRWLRELGLVADAQRLDEVAADGNGGVLCVPALSGLAAPWWDPHATATMTGMTLSTGRGEIVRAVLEGIAAQVAVLGAVMADDLGMPLHRLRVDGGLTQSAVLMQAQANLAQIPLDVYPSQHATALGAAACARLSLDASLSVEESVSSWKSSHTFEPRWSAGRAGAHLEAWNEAVAVSLSRRGERKKGEP